MRIAYELSGPQGCTCDSVTHIWLGWYFIGSVIHLRSILSSQEHWTPHPLGRCGPHCTSTQWFISIQDASRSCLLHIQCSPNALPGDASRLMTHWVIRTHHVYMMFSQAS